MRKELRLEKCPLTLLPIIGHSAIRQKHVYPEGVAYWVTYKGNRKFIRLCLLLFAYLQGHELADYEKEELVDINEHLRNFWGIIVEDEFSNLFGKTIHYNCDVLFDTEPEKNIHIKRVSEQALENGFIPLNRKEKVHTLLKLIQENQSFQGEEVEYKGKLEFWAKAQLINAKELEYFIQQTQKTEFIESSNGKIKLTFKGLDYIEGINKPQLIINEEEMYQIGLSFAGEQRDYVEKVATALATENITVFYDDYEKVQLWGKDLYQHLNDVYKNRCEYCLIFISEDYGKKLWTQHELKSAQTKAFTENKEYILPVKFDDTEIPGLNDTVGYLDGNSHTPEQIATLAIAKLNQQ